MDAEIPKKVESVRWVGDTSGRLVLVDQTRLPLEFVERTCEEVSDVWEAIRALRVRGAPAIGIAAAYGVCLGMRPHVAAPRRAFLESLDSVHAYLASSRPTAVNLFWALDRMRDAARRMPDTEPLDPLRRLLDEATAIHAEDRETCRAIGRNGASLFADGQGVLTHCNAGGLATSEYGTALAVLFTAQDQGKRLRVFVDETRPLLQGARLTAWELGRRGIPATLICDSMAAQVMRERKVHAVIVGADRIAANGDTANKIGTYGLAVLAHAHGIPFHVAAPCSTFDWDLPDGDGIPIEERAAEEITEGFGRRTAPYGVDVYNPAFDVTPARFISAIVTERAVIQPVTAERIARVLGSR
ncbi:MAG: S-methyl-5-thioribose-1-phosphate isomerase [Planctomycetes bacterium]|nr:S-methyl-5-thioribose-1-phosphate isomerase [Planctomycetota bacterium]